MSLFKYKIKLNNKSFSNKKKNIILLIRKSPGEIDWILPLLFILKKKYNIFTIFRFSQTLELLKENNILYKIWKNSCFGYTVEPKLKSIFYRTLHHTFKKTIFQSFFTKKFVYDYYNVNIIQDFIYELGNSRKKIQSEPHALFLEFTNYSPWIKNFYKKNKNIKIIYFPHTTNIFGVKKNNIKNKKFYGNNYLLLNSEYDLKFWKHKIGKINIIITGYLKYDKLWLKKILRKKIKKKKEKIIYFSCKGFIRNLDNYEKYDQQIRSLMDIVNKIQNLKVLFKLHPSTKIEELKKILENYPKNKWKFSNDNQQNLINLSDVVISTYNSASIIESLASKKVPVELWNITNNEYSKSKFKKLKLSFFVNNKSELEKTIMLLLNKNSLFKENKKIINKFKKNFFTNKSIDYAKNKINKILKINNLNLNVK